MDRRRQSIPDVGSTAICASASCWRCDPVQRQNGVSRGVCAVYHPDGAGRHHSAHQRFRDARFPVAAVFRSHRLPKSCAADRRGSAAEVRRSVPGQQQSAAPDQRQGRGTRTSGAVKPSGMFWYPTNLRRQRNDRLNFNLQHQLPGRDRWLRHLVHELRRPALHTCCERS